MAEDPKPPNPAPGTGPRPAARVVGPVAPAVYTPGQKSGIFKATAAPLSEPLVTEGMKARQREIEKKRRAVAMLRQVEAEEAEDNWRRYRRWIFVFVGVLAAAGVYWKLQDTYHDRWPLLAVWLVLGSLVLAALFWLIWFLDYSD